jgi:putative ABC transport system permease protein
MVLPLSYNVRSLWMRWPATLLAIIGIALVVLVFVAMLAMVTGFRLALRSTGRPDNAIVTQKGSAGELMSGIAREHANLIMVDSRVARGADGQPLASPETLVMINMPKRSDGLLVNVTLRGVTPRAFDVRGGIRLLEGRMFRPGVNEIIVGRAIQDRIRGLELGAKVTTRSIQRRDWEIVGVFVSDGSAFESEIWGDLETLAPSFRKNYQSVVLRLANPATLAEFDNELQANPQLQVRLSEERRYYEQQAGRVGQALLALVGLVSVIMGIGAVFGAMNTMYGIVSARGREIATLRAIGFPRLAILVSFVVESVLLAVVGGAIGCALALPVNNLAAGTALASFNELAFAFRITPAALAAGFVFAVVMGALGGLLPAIRAARLPISAAVREG